jgi:hypothetical protein
MLRHDISSPQSLVVERSSKGVGRVAHPGNRWSRLGLSMNSIGGMVDPNGLEPSTSSVSRKRSNQTELRAYMRMAAVSILPGAG